jgi:hypothetical protein
VSAKQAAALKLDALNSIAEANIFIQNLTGCDGKIREAVSFRLEEFVKKNPEYFENFANTFLVAIIDINGNICRNTICALNYLKNNKNFCDEFCPELFKRSINLAKLAKTFDLQDGKYKINKEIFKLYWYLETIYNYSDCFEISKLNELIVETKDIIDYTIREKTAKIISKIEKNENILKIQKELKNDPNYYVRRF